MSWSRQRLQAAVSNFHKTEDSLTPAHAHGKVQDMKDTRLVVLVEAKQMKALRAAAKKQKISLGEVVRRAIDKAVK